MIKNNSVLVSLFLFVVLLGGKILVKNTKTDFYVLGNLLCLLKECVGKDREIANIQILATV
jgi:hypothetical protein